MSALDRVLSALAPRWALARERARYQTSVLRRHYEAAAAGRRTSNWNKSSADVNAALSGALPSLRGLSRDLIRNNAWARRGVQAITNNTVGWGIKPKFMGPQSQKVEDAWARWAETTECDAEGRLTFYGLQKQAMRTIVEAGEVLIRKRVRRAADGLTVPLQLQILEPDFLDTSQNNIKGIQGGWIIQGVEHDAIGRRVAYWLFNTHPGSSLSAPVSSRVPADSVIHVFQQERPGQVRGVPWLAPIIVRLRDFDEYEDATLLRQKIAACFAAFVTDDGDAPPLGAAEEDGVTGKPVDVLEPGMVEYLPPGRQVTFAVPPSTSDHPSFSTAMLRAVAAGLGVTYEDLTGDYSQVNYSSGRLGRSAHWANVHSWRWDTIIPQLCAGTCDWFLTMMTMAELGVSLDLPEKTSVTWTPPPQPMMDPEKEGLALMRLVRSGAMTHDQMIREQGFDPDEHWKEYAEGLDRLDELGIVLDSDPRRVTQGGVKQSQDKPTSDPASAPKPNGKPNGVMETGADASEGQAEA